MYSREAFCLLNHHFENVLETPHDVMARAAMQLGAFYAGIAIEQSMLGAAHACANPLTARFQMAHGVALGIVLPHVVRWNAQTSADLYRELISNSDNLKETTTTMDSGLQLADRLVNIGNACGFPSRLRDTGVLKNDLEALARAAAEQWTGTFNPRPFSTSEALEVYECAY